MGGILLGFLVLINWIAFGPGKRECTQTISLPFWQNTSQTSCKGPFAFFAVVMWLIILFIAIPEALKKGKKEEEKKIGKKIGDSALIRDWW